VERPGLAKMDLIERKGVKLNLGRERCKNKKGQKRRIVKGCY
jgi:hypothetical protein